MSTETLNRKAALNYNELEMVCGGELPDRFTNNISIYIPIFQRQGRDITSILDRTPDEEQKKYLIEHWNVVI